MRNIYVLALNLRDFSIVDTKSINFPVWHCINANFIQLFLFFNHHRIRSLEFSCTNFLKILCIYHTSNLIYIPILVLESEAFSSYVIMPNRIILLAECLAI